jgi:hypothetical protein
LFGVIAQLVERLLCKQDVGGSNPSGSIKIIYESLRCCISAKSVNFSSKLKPRFLYEKRGLFVFEKARQERALTNRFDSSPPLNAKHNAKHLVALVAKLGAGAAAVCDIEKRDQCPQSSTRLRIVAALDEVIGEV